MPGESAALDAMHDFREVLGEQQHEIDRLTQRITGLEGGVGGAKEVLEERMASLQRELIHEIGKQFDEVLEKMRQDYLEELSRFKQYDLPDAISEQMQDRRKAMWAKAKTWGWPIGFGVMGLLTMLGGGSVVDGLGYILRGFG